MLTARVSVPVFCRAALTSRVSVPSPACSRAPANSSLASYQVIISAFTLLGRVILRSLTRLTCDKRVKNIGKEFIVDEQLVMKYEISLTVFAYEINPIPEVGTQPERKRALLNPNNSSHTISARIRAHF